MFDIGWQEIFIIAVVLIIVVGPKDLPRVLRTVGHWTAKARAMVREFQGHVDDMIRESELDDFKQEIEKAADNPLGQAYDRVVGDNGEIAEAFEFGGEEFKAIDSGGEKDPEKSPETDDAAPESPPELARPAAAAKD